MSVLTALATMDEEAFTTLSVSILCTGLIAYMCFIIYKLAKDSKAGKYGTIVLAFVLGLGMLGFIAKTILTQILQK
ncbi:Protein of unknown function [Andreprevotia lacus DSM 23236]|jgi:uncharacterized membrane protein YkvI|uniref:DUF2788 domain-containing protein n=1 Tax=Andreprevotia lacus DSM 23236 TaxID=1121001 RepID=A0A1W1WZ42_9NEIS|nr:DUF2788 domain-containing protein [Andreprevotia lacus]SMC16915.1 Protein of unknown function [Andreprevotia lacus DSM 23236]